MSKTPLSSSDQLTEKQSYMGSVYTYFFKRRDSNTSHTSSASVTTTNSSESTDFYYDITEKEEFSLIDSLDTMPFPRLLRLLQEQPLVTNQIEHEFPFIANKIKEISHCLDTERPSTQYANTSAIIGSNLVLAAKFMVQRYHDDMGDSWLALIGLLIIGVQALETPNEVKKELLNNTKIGRVLVLDMSKVLKLMKKQNLSDRLRLVVMRVVFDICHQEDQTWLSLLKVFCRFMSDYDHQWDFKQEYDDIASMAMSSFFC